MKYAPKLSLTVSKASVDYIDSRLTMRKFDLGVAAAPLGASFFLLDHVISLKLAWQDVLLSEAVFFFIFNAVTAAVQIHRYSFMKGRLLSEMAQTNSASGNRVYFRPGVSGLNQLELVFNVLGYSIIIFFLLQQIWEFSF